AAQPSAVERGVRRNGRVRRTRRPGLAGASGRPSGAALRAIRRVAGRGDTGGHSQRRFCLPALHGLFRGRPHYGGLTGLPWFGLVGRPPGAPAPPPARFPGPVMALPVLATPPRGRPPPGGAAPPTILILLLLTIVFYWKIALTDQFTYLENPDLAYQVLPWYQFEARAMHRTSLPLWDPFQWCGQSVLGEVLPGSAFPLNWPRVLAPFKDGHLNFAWVHRHFIFIHWLAAIFMYAFCRQLGSSRFAGILAGAAFSFGGYMGTTPWPQMIDGAMWIPLIFLFFHRLVEAGQGAAAFSNAALCGASIGLALLSGHHQAPTYTLLALCGVFLYFLFARRQPARLLSLFAVVGLFAFLVGALQVLPAWEYGTRAYRWVGLPEPVRMQQTVPYFAGYTLGIFPL